MTAVDPTQPAEPRQPSVPVCPAAEVTPLWALAGLSDEALDRNIDQAAHDRCDDLGALLAERERRLDRRNPRIKLARLVSQAEGHDLRAERLRDEAAEYWGKAAYRQTKGDHDLAFEFSVKARARDSLANKAQAQAVTLRLEAAVLKARIEQSEALMGIVAPT